MMSGSQIRAARKLLNWSPDRLAKRARLAVGVVLQAELSDGPTLMSVAAARSIRQALEDGGVALTGGAPMTGQVRSAGGRAAVPPPGS